MSRVTTEPEITAPHGTMYPYITTLYGVTEPDTSATADLPFKGDINLC